MPRPRLPWGKFWWELVDHPKFAELEDGERWTWVEVWAKAAMLPKRWHYASVRHAAKVSGRPAAHIERLIAVRLLDQLEDGSVVVHDAKQWQEWKYGAPEADADTDRDAETPAKDSGNPRETPAKARDNPAETTANGVAITRETPLETLKKNGELRPETKETREDGPASSARARASEAARVIEPDEELLANEFLASLNDELPGANEVPEPHHPTVEKKPIPLARPPASADELLELQRFFAARYAEAGASEVFRATWARLQERYPRASGKRLNDMLDSELERCKAKTLAVTVDDDDPYAGIEIRARSA